MSADVQAARPGPDPGSGSVYLSVGAVAARLGVAPGTVRSWGRRYGLVPSGRTQGGHRRYTVADLNTLKTMQDLTGRGAKPAAAAREALALTSTPAGGSTSIPPVAPTKRRGGPPGGAALTIPGGSPPARNLARIVSRLDADSAMGVLSELLIEHGAVHTWDNVLRPVLRALGEQWARTDVGIDTEHVLSQATIEALYGYRSFLPRPSPGRPVLLASARTDQHTLPIHLVAAALAERRIPHILLGSQVPPAALTSAARRTGASGLFLWRQLREPVDERDDMSEVEQFQDSLTLVIGGPGWIPAAVPATAITARDAADAVTLLAATPR